MWFELRREDLGFRQRAPITHVTDAEIAAPRAAVFAAVADPTTWPRWFPNVREAYSGATPPGVGTVRQALVGGTRWVEEMIAWDPDRCWAYTIVRSSVPMAWAQVEVFEFEDAARGGTRARWTLALEPRLLARLGGPFFAAVVDRLFRSNLLTRPSMHPAFSVVPAS